ncbi:MAG: nucleotidyltransferase domain-containing protein [Verrucomicrobiia bacterium]
MNAEIKRNLEQALPECVLEFLLDTAREFRLRGLELILFGSFAQGRQRPNSDLDLGVRWTSTPDRNLRRQLADRLDALPSIRPIDLVDLDAADETLRAEIARHAVPLADL